MAPFLYIPGGLERLFDFFSDFIVVAADDDDEVRISASQNHVTATLCNKKFVLRTQYTYIAFPSYHQ